MGSMNGICRIGIIRFTNDVSYESLKRKIASFARDDAEAAARLSARGEIVPGHAHRPSG